MAWTWKKIAGLFIPIFVLSILGWVYYVYIVLMCAGFYGALGFPAVAVLLAIPFHVILFFFMWSWSASVFRSPGTIPDLWREAPEAVEGAPAPRHCKICNKFKPERAHHCSTCGEYANQTLYFKLTFPIGPWLNNCVGYRNYKYFFQFLSYAILLCAYVMLSTLHRVIAGMASIGDYTHPVDLASMQSMILAVIALSFTGGVSFLLVYHVRLLKRNMTTLEDWGDDRRSPYDMGELENFYAVFGRQKLLWFLPVPGPLPDGDGTTFRRIPEDPELETLKGSAENV